MVYNEAAQTAAVVCSSAPVGRVFSLLNSKFDEDEKSRNNYEVTPIFVELELW